MPVRMMPGGFGGRMMGDLFAPGIGGEVIYSFIIIVCSLLIYFGTKELYELSSHRGIKYFRQAFLFFAIAYFFRTFIKFVILYFEIAGIIEFSPIEFGAAGLLAQLAFVYFSSMSIFYLLYSIMWKRWNKNNNRSYILHGLAVGIALISILFRSPFLYLVLNIILVFVVLVAIYISYEQRNKKKGQGLYLIYSLWLFFWVLNIVDVLIPNFFQGFQLLIYLISTSIFLIILYKVVRRTGSN